MAKSKRELQREIYDYIEEQCIDFDRHGVVLQEILNKFCKKYSLSTTTITRHLDELVQKRGPFRLVTWYDKNRYYAIHTISLRIQVYLVLSTLLPIAFYILDLFDVTQIKLFEKSLIFLFAFWLSYALNGQRTEGYRFFSKLGNKKKHRKSDATDAKRDV